MRSVLRCIEAAALAALLALCALATVVPGVAHADVSSGVTCQMLNGIYLCTDGSVGNNGSVCVTDNVTGSRSCLTSNGGTSTGAISNLGKGLGQVLQLPSGASSSGWLSKLTGWFANVVHTLFTAMVQVLKDLVTYVVGVVLDLVAAAISAIGVPDFLTNYSLSSVLGNAGPIVGFFLVQLQVPAGLGLIGAGYAFRLLRKFLTLFQW